VVADSGLTSFSSEIHFALTDFASGIPNPGSVTIYRRAAAGTGLFAPLATAYNSVANDLRATVSGFGEFIFGSDDNDLTSVEQYSPAVPEQFSLGQNYPNPFNPLTQIRFSIPAGKGGSSGDRLVTLKIYDLLGREAATLVHEELRPGTYAISWDAGGQSSGVYYYRLQTENSSDIKKMMLLK